MSSPSKPTLSRAQERILRSARDTDAVIVSGIQRRSVERLRQLRLVTYTTEHVPSGSINGRDQITVEITGAGVRYFLKPPRVRMG